MRLTQFQDRNPVSVNTTLEVVIKSLFIKMTKTESQSGENLQLYRIMN